MRIVYMGSPDFAVPPLAALLAAGHQVVLVVTQPDRPRGRGKKLQPTPVKELALAQQLPLLQPDNVNEAEAVAAIAACQPDLLVVVAYGQLLKAPLLALAPLGAVNVHASLLPFYRGAAPINWMLMNGETLAGVTTMYMDKGMDTGDMILRAECAIAPEDNAGTLHDKLASLGAQLLVETVAQIAAGTAPRTPQDHDLATYASLLKREHELIDWNKSAAEIVNQIRGLAPLPAAYTLQGDKRLKIVAAALTEGTGAPGEVIALRDDEPVVACAQGALVLKTVKPEGKGAMAAAAFQRGHGLAVGERLG